MTNSRQSSPTWILLVLLFVWLFFMNGLSTVKQWSASGSPGGIVSTIQRGVSRIAAPPAASVAPPKPAAPGVTAPRASGNAPAAPDQAQIEAAANAAYQATAQASQSAGNVASAPVVPASTLPNAVINIPTAVPATQVVVVPQRMPVLAQSGPAQPTAIPTMAYPTPLPAGAAAYRTSADGKCVIAPRNGTMYQVCQEWKYKPDEAASVADYIRTGLLPGSPVQ